jgi:hypothetical protein
VQTIRTLTAAFAEANKEANALGADTSKWRQSLQELQAMSGKPEALGPEVEKENIALIRRGLTQQQALGFQQHVRRGGGRRDDARCAGQAAIYPGNITRPWNRRWRTLPKSMGGDPKEFAQAWPVDI